MFDDGFGEGFPNHHHDADYGYNNNHTNDAEYIYNSDHISDREDVDKVTPRRGITLQQILNSHTQHALVFTTPQSWQAMQPFRDDKPAWGAAATSRDVLALTARSVGNTSDPPSDPSSDPPSDISSAGAQSFSLARLGWSEGSGGWRYRLTMVVESGVSGRFERINRYLRMHPAGVAVGAGEGEGRVEGRGEGEGRVEGRVEGTGEGGNEREREEEGATGKEERREIILLTHMGDEALLLPQWIRHHAPLFHRAYLFDYNSSDASVDVARALAPSTVRVGVGGWVCVRACVLVYVCGCVCACVCVCMRVCACACSV